MYRKFYAYVVLLIKRAFERERVEVYLDLLDDNISSNGKILTNHIKEQLNSCTDIVVITSENTKLSWWLPLEIEM